MNICFLCSEYPPTPHGGIGSVTQILARALVRNGHSVRVIGASRASDQPREEDEGVEVWRMPLPSKRFTWMAARYQLFSKIAEWARKRAIHLIEAPDWEGWSAGWPKLPIPVVVRLHGSSSYFSAELGLPCQRSTFWLERAALRRSDFYCSTSRYTAEKTSAVFALQGQPDAVIYNPVELRPAENTHRSRNQVVFSGTLTPKKGLMSLAKAWLIVKKEFPAAELHVFGKDGLTRERTSMRAAVAKEIPEEYQASVHFYGHTPRAQVIDALRRARAAVFPSYAEAFAMAPLEAMAEGCPTIYSRLGSGPELIEHGRDGLLIDPSDPEDIAAALLSVLRSDALAARLEQNGRERVRRTFSSDVIVRKNEEFYANCVQQFHTRNVTSS